MAQPLNEYVVNGKQIFNLFGIGNPDAVPPVPPTTLITTIIDPTGFDTNGAAETWANTHTAVTRTKALNSLSNPQVMAVQKAILVCNNNTVPTASIGIEADNSGGIGTYYGMNLFNNNDTNFGITSTMPYQGSVVFDQEGSGATTTTTAIKQGLITITDPTVPLATSFNASTLTSGASSRTWADIISNTGSSNTLQQVLLNGNTATGPQANITLTDTDAGGALNPILNLVNTNATGSVAMETYKNKPTAGIAGDPLFTHSCFGKDSANGKQEYTRITHTIRDPTNGSEEGSIEMGCFIAGAYANMLQLNGVDTPAGEVNVLRPIDLSTGSTGLIKVSGTGSTNMTLDATLSAGTGNIALNPRAIGSVQVNGNLRIPSNADNLVIGSGVYQGIMAAQGTNYTSTAGVGAFAGLTFNGLRLGNGTLFAEEKTNIQTAQDITIGDTTNNKSITINNAFATNSNRISTFTSDNVDLEGTIALTTTYNDQALNFTSSNSTSATSKSLVLENAVGGGTLAYINNSGDTTGLTINSANNNLLLKSTSVISGQGNIEFAPSQFGTADGQLVFTGASLQSNSAGGNSGEHLVIVLNGTTYKIKLENP